MSALLEVANGDLVVLGGDCQKTHDHGVPPPTKAEMAAKQPPRINATARFFSPRPAGSEKKRKRPTGSDAPSAAGPPAK